MHRDFAVVGNKIWDNFRRGNLYVASSRELRSSDVCRRALDGVLHTPTLVVGLDVATKPFAPNAIIKLAKQTTKPLIVLAAISLERERERVVSSRVVHIIIL